MLPGPFPYVRSGGSSHFRNSPSGRVPSSVKFAMVRIDASKFSASDIALIGALMMKFATFALFEEIDSRRCVPAKRKGSFCVETV